MHFIEKKAEQKRIDFDNKLKSKKILRIPGAYNPLTAKLIEEIGYDGVYVSGGVMSNDLGYPDIGLTTLGDVTKRSEQIARVTNLPTIVDIDTGFKSCRKQQKRSKVMELQVFIQKIKLREKDVDILITKNLSQVSK